MQERPSIEKYLLTIAAIAVSTIAVMCLLFWLGLPARWHAIAGAVASCASSMTFVFFFLRNNQFQKQGQRK